MFFLIFSPRSRVQPLNPPPPRPCPFQDDFRAFRRQLDDKRPLIEQSILTGRQLVANEAPLSDASDSEGNSSLDSSMCVCRILRKEEKKKNIFFLCPSRSLPLSPGSSLFTAGLRDELIDELPDRFPSRLLLVALVLSGMKYRSKKHTHNTSAVFLLLVDDCVLCCHSSQF